MADRIIIGDIETDGFKPSVIHMVGILDYHTDEFTSYVGDEVPNGILRLLEADLVIGHHFIGYDVKQIERLTEGLVQFERSKIVDTLDLSKRAQELKLLDLENLKLETFGEMFGYPKLKFKNFKHFTPEMIPYCERDCRLNKRVFDYLMELLG